MKIELKGNLNKVKNKLKKIDYAYIYCMLITCSILLLCMFNVISHGKVIDELFFVNKTETGMDFYGSIITSYQNIVTRLSEATGFYPTIAFVIIRLIYISLPSEITKNLPQDAFYKDRYLVVGTPNDLRLQQQAVILWMILIIVSIIFLVCVIYKIKEGSVRDRLWFTACGIFTFGSLYAIERTNLVLLCVPLIFLFLYWKDSENKLCAEIALLCLALAAGIKLYPAVFGILLISDKQYYKAFRTMIYGLFTTIGPIICFGGIEAAVNYKNAIVQFSESNGFGTLNSMSLQTIFKSICTCLGISNNKMVFNVQYVSYLFLVVGIVLAWAVQTKWKKILVLTLIMILVPGTSFYYSLFFLLIPFTYFINECSGNAGVKNNIYFSFFIIMLVPFYTSVLDIVPDSKLPLSAFIRQLSILVMSILTFSDCLISLILLKMKGHKS